MLCVQHAQQLIFSDDKQGSWRYGRSRAHAKRLARHASLAKKVSGAKHGNNGFLSGPVHHGKFHAAILDIHDGIRGVALRVDRFISPISNNFSLHPGGVEKDLRVEKVGLSILLSCIWFHIQIEAPTTARRSTPTSILPKGIPKKLYKSEQNMVWKASKIRAVRRGGATVAGIWAGPDSVSPLAVLPSWRRESSYRGIQSPWLDFVIISR